MEYPDQNNELVASFGRIILSYEKGAAAWSTVKTPAA